jgi:hypothetical protein
MSQKRKADKSMTCYECHEKLESDGKMRVRQRKRRCKSCSRSALSEKRRSDPVRRLQQRFNNNIRNWWPNEKDLPKLGSMEVVRQILDNCSSKSVLSGETNLDLLNIIPKAAVDPNAVPGTISSFVIVTKEEARELNRMKPGERAACFVSK